MSFLFNWISNALSYLGFSPSKKAHLLFLGLDNAGKTSLLHLLVTGKLHTHEPTRFPGNEELVIGNVTFNTHDLGGHKAARRMWRQYFTNVDGVVFIVDAADSKRFDEAKEVLSLLLSEEVLQGIPFLILGNKIDSKGAVSEEQLKEALGIFNTCGKETKKSKLQEGTQPIEVFMCSVVKKFRYTDGFKWLAEHV